MRLQPVEVIVVFPLSRHPEESHILNLGRNDRKVCLHISVQEVGHHHSISHDVNHEVTDAREIFDLQCSQWPDEKYLLVISHSLPAAAAYLILIKPYREIFTGSDKFKMFHFFVTAAFIQLC